MGYRHMRLDICGLIGSTDSFVSMASLEVAAVIGGPNIATDVSKATVSSYASSSFNVDKLFDDNNTTYWSSASVSINTVSNVDSTGTSNPYRLIPSGQPKITYDFGVEVEIAEIRIMPYVVSGSPHATNARDIVVRVSNDGVVWEILAIFMAISYSSSKKSLSIEDYLQNPVSNKIVRNFSVKRIDRNLHGNFSAARSHYIQDAQVLRRAVLPFSGGGVIQGTTTVLGFPYSRHVLLFDELTNNLVAKTITGADGVFEFKNLKKGIYSVVGVDTTLNQNSVIYAHIETED